MILALFIRNITWRIPDHICHGAKKYDPVAVTPALAGVSYEFDSVHPKHYLLTLNTFHALL